MFSQDTVSYRKVGMTGDGQKITYMFDDIVNSIKRDGWNGSPLNVVRIPDGSLASIDSARLLPAGMPELMRKLSYMSLTTLCLMLQPLNMHDRYSTDRDDFLNNLLDIKNRLKNDDF